MQRWRHKKRGTVYEVLFDNASLQCSCDSSVEEMFDDCHFTVYRSVDTRALYVCPTPEFLDGRFELVPE